MHRTLSRVARVGASSRPSRALGAALLASAGLAAATTTSAQAQALPDPPDTHLAARAFALTGPLDEPILTRFDVTDPTKTVDIPVLGVSEAETLVAIDVRPMNGMLYGLGIDDVADAGTLYVIDPVNGFAAPVGARGDVNYWVSSGPSAPPLAPAVAVAARPPPASASRRRARTGTSTSTPRPTSSTSSRAASTPASTRTRGGRTTASTWTTPRAPGRASPARRPR